MMTTNEARRVIEGLATDRGYVLEELRDEIAARGYPKHEAQAALLTGDLDEWNALLQGYIGAVIGMSRVEMHQLMDALMADVAASYGEPPPPRVAPPRK
jgi:hypothetical protein